MKNIFSLSSRLVLIFFLSMLSTVLVAQNNVGIGTMNPDPQAILDLTSHTKGLLVPRLTTNERYQMNLATNPDGLIVYDTDQHLFFYWHGALLVWYPFVPNPFGHGSGSVPDGASPGNVPYWDGISWQTNSGNFYDNGGNIGIGTTNPQRTLHVNAVMRLEPINTPPSSPSKGDMYFDGTINKLRVYDGTTWQDCW